MLMGHGKGGLMKRDTLFWDVDTQFDFMMPQGRLYVPGAEAIVARVSETRRLALEGGYSILADVDWHRAGNAEISDVPDFERTFPPHCMAGQPGAERVGYLGELPIEYVDMDRMPVESLRRLVETEQFHVVIRKEQLDVFENPNTAELVRLVGPRCVVVFGVALDFCVSCVINGLLGLGGIGIVLLSDVTKGLGTRPDEELLERFRLAGVEVSTLGELERGL